MKVRDIREKFTQYFVNQGHRHVESSSLVPHNDPTLLFTNAGMNQFKDVFTGKEKRDYTRAVTVQKCVRAGGKHNDLENVGFTARHHTFFEMLGNFSFGDYFKKEAIHFAWEFVTGQLRLPESRLHVTVYQDDDEAYDIWHKGIGLPTNKIYRLGEKDNFWSMGDTGPCGPCSEIFVDRGPRFEGEPVNSDGDRYMEIWNLVFMQFERDKSGILTPLPKKSVDTGAGLERIASVLQDVETNYDTDIFMDIMRRTSDMVGKAYKPGTKDAFAFRVIADHARATAFLIGDGVMPANEGRGYVLRRIMRRAIRYGRNLGFRGPFLHKVTGFVIDQMQDAYPDLPEKRAFIDRAVLAEEEQFLRTLERGLGLLDEEMAKAKGGQISGDVAFKLYDTYGFPVDLTRVIATENKLNVDEAGFEACMAQQRQQSRKNWKGSGDEAVGQIYHKLAEDLKARGITPQFVGYEALSTDSKCLKLLVEDGDSLQEVTEVDAARLTPEQAVLAVFDKTPFYPEGGGQVGDSGAITGETGTADVIDTQKPVGDLIVLHLKNVKGQLSVGKTYRQNVQNTQRLATARNHTATHLLHWALRKALGEHVKQAGSLVTADMLRFDFSHFQALTRDELERVETLVNEIIWQAPAVGKRFMSKDAATAAGAIAFFGEKYGSEVRVVNVGEVSTELCGGTHVDSASDIQLFKIISEASVAAGVRRIVAYTSKQAFTYLREREEEARSLRERLKANNRGDAEGKIDKLLGLEKELKRLQEKERAATIGQEVDELLGKASVIQDISLISHVCPADADGVKRLRDLAERLKQKATRAVIVLGMKDETEGKAYILVATGKDVPAKIKANELVNSLAPHIEGRGGGKPDFAQAGGTKWQGLAEAMRQAPDLIKARLSS